jgi:hypothetical protein
MSFRSRGARYTDDLTIPIASCRSSERIYHGMFHRMSKNLRLAWCCTKHTIHKSPRPLRVSFRHKGSASRAHVLTSGRFILPSASPRQRDVSSIMAQATARHALGMTPAVLWGPKNRTQRLFRCSDKVVIPNREGKSRCREDRQGGASCVLRASRCVGVM